MHVNVTGNTGTMITSLSTMTTSGNDRSTRVASGNDRRVKYRLCGPKSCQIGNFRGFSKIR